MFDEPTAGMSLEEAPVVLDLIARLKRQGGRTILLVAHKMVVIRALANRIVVLHNGHLAADGAPAEVMVSTLMRRAGASAPALSCCQPADRPASVSGLPFNCFFGVLGRVLEGLFRCLTFFGHDNAVSFDLGNVASPEEAEEPSQEKEQDNHADNDPDRPRTASSVCHSHSPFRAGQDRWLSQHNITLP